MTIPTLFALGLFGLIGGIGITAVGPGGILPTIGLFTLTDLSPTEVAGTAIVTHIATGALATAAYTRSGQLRDPDTRRMALLLSVTALLATPVGVAVNGYVSSRGFGVVLAVFVTVTALLVWYRERRSGAEQRPAPRAWVVVTLGCAVALAAGVIGIGGPMLTVPLLVMLKVPVLESLAAAQAQSVVIATVGSLGYLAGGGIDWGLAAVVGIPELAGVLLGWRIAHALPTRTLKYTLIITLLALAPYLALSG